MPYYPHYNLTATIKIPSDLFQHGVVNEEVLIPFEREGYTYLVPDIYEDSESIKKIEEGQEIDLTPTLMESMLKSFKTKYKDEIKVLQRHYPDSTVMLSFLYGYE